MKPFYYKNGIRLPNSHSACKKDLINSRTALLLVHTNNYSMIEDHYKKKIVPAVVHLKTADGSAMSSLGKGTLHPHIANFKLNVTSYWTQIFYLESIFRRDTLYHIVGMQTNNYSYKWKAPF